MTKHFTPAPKARGIVMVRADASNPTQVLADMKRAFEEFKAEREAEIADLKKGQQDVVRSEKIDKINTEISALQTSLDEANSTLAALRTGFANQGSVILNQQNAAHEVYRRALWHSEHFDAGGKLLKFQQPIFLIAKSGLLRQG